MTAKHQLVKAFSQFSGLVARLVSKTPLWYPFSKAVIDIARDKQIVVNTSPMTKFHVPNDRNNFRARTLLTKEPETITWINSFESDCVLWDVGACIGTYSIYGALTRNARVIAVEPSVFNLEWLARNIFSNSLQTRITIVPLALSNSTFPQELNMQVTEWGGSMSSFGVDYDDRGCKFVPRFQYVTGGCRADLLMTSFGLPKPDYLKIDVDSIEHLILEGFGIHLSEIKSIAIENSKNETVKSDCELILKRNEFECVYEGRANSIWRKTKNAPE